MSVKRNQPAKLLSETALAGRIVSRGVASGHAVCLHGSQRQFYRTDISAARVERELRRFRAAVRLAKRQLTQLASSKTNASRQIFETHLLILEDNSLLTKIEEIISGELVNAEWAVKSATDYYLAIYRDIKDEHLRERRIDLEDVTARVLTALGGGGRKTLTLKKDSILVASEVRPSTLIELDQGNIKAIVTENGGWTSHTFIVARELNIPALTGVKNILRRMQTGDKIVVDALNGRVVLNPSDADYKKFSGAAERSHSAEAADSATGRKDFVTLDGRRITVRVNLDITRDYQAAKKLGAKGIGLFRSEYLFNQNQGYPTEVEQLSVYRKIARIAGADGVKIRTFDLNHEQILDETEIREKNPALGLRAIRLSFAREKEFRVQLRALLQASLENNLAIVLPMISDVVEIRRARKIIAEEKSRLKKRGIESGAPALGAMIEVPSAVLMSEEIINETDFVSLGTNDLIQYLLGVDRDNEAVADSYRTLHPAVLKAVGRVVEAAESNGKSAIICGEMAGSPVYAPVLIGLGATELSMNVNSISRVGNVINQVAYEECLQLSKILQTSKTAAESEKAAHQFISEKWSHLFSSELFGWRKV